jgi:hypothetical protein
MKIWKTPLWEAQPGMILRATDSKIVDWIKLAQDASSYGFNLRVP